MAESTQTLAEDTGAQPGGDAEEHVSEYTTETSAEAEARPAARRPVVTGSALGTGRRKEAIARVRITPGTGQWRINERPLIPSERRAAMKARTSSGCNCDNCSRLISLAKWHERKRRNCETSPWNKPVTPWPALPR